MGDFLIFPSLLETWGLPISEFEQTNKKMILANLPYAFALFFLLILQQSFEEFVDVHIL